MEFDVSEYTRRISFRDSGEAFWAACIFTAIADAELHEEERETILSKLPHLLGQVRYKDQPLAAMLRPFPGLNEEEWPEIYRFVSKFWDPASRGDRGGIVIASLSLDLDDDGSMQDKGGKPLAAFWDEIAEIWSNLLNAIRAKMTESGEAVRQGSAEGVFRLAEWTGPVIDAFVADFSSKVCVHFAGQQERTTFLFSAILGIGAADGDSVGAERMFVTRLARDLGIEEELKAGDTSEMARKYALNLDSIPTIVSGVIDPDSPRSKRLDRMGQISDRLDETASRKPASADAMRQLLALAASASPQTAENFRAWSSSFEEMVHSDGMPPKSDDDVLRRIRSAAFVLDNGEAGQFLDDMVEILSLQSLEHFSSLPRHVDVLAFLMNGKKYAIDDYRPEIVEMTANDAGETETIRLGGALEVLGAIAFERFGADRQGALVDRYIARVKELAAERDTRNEAEEGGTQSGPHSMSAGASIMRVANPAKPDFVISDGKIVSIFGVPVEYEPDPSEAAPLSRIRSAEETRPEKADAFRSLLALVHVQSPQIAGLARAAMDERALEEKSSAWNELIARDSEKWWKGPLLKQVLSRLDGSELTSFLDELSAVLIARDIVILEGLDLDSKKKFLSSGGEFKSARYAPNISSFDIATTKVEVGGGLAMVAVVRAASTLFEGTEEEQGDVMARSASLAAHAYISVMSKKIGTLLNGGERAKAALFDPEPEFRRLKRYLGKSKGAPYKKRAYRELLHWLVERYGQVDPPDTLESYLAFVEEALTLFDEMSIHSEPDDQVLRSIAIGRVESFFRRSKYAVSDELEGIFAASRDLVGRNGDVLAEIREREEAPRRSHASQVYASASGSLGGGPSDSGSAAESKGKMFGCMLVVILLAGMLAKCAA